MARYPPDMDPLAGSSFQQNFNVNSMPQFYPQHGAAFVKLEPVSSTGMNFHAAPHAPLMPQATGRNGAVKYCGVCGDIAKSYHFGGLSCDSCKAFFRRSVQNDNYLHFQCCHQGQCVISLSNRKSCQYCRMNRCFAIGMEKSWVMTEEERKALMKARAEKKLTKQLAAAATSTVTMGRSLFHFSGDGEMGSPNSSGSGHDYEPQIERMVDFLSPLEIKEIESIVTKYLHSYQHVPYRTELRYFDQDRPGVQVMEMFGTLIRRFAFYARLMPDFVSLPFNDQSSLLKGGVLEMCVLRGALVFDPLKNRWPNANMAMYKDAPVLKLENIGHMTSSRIFQLHMEFISCIQEMGVDEPTIMLLVLIVLFTPERAGLLQVHWVEKYQSYYTSLLERYMSWRFGSPRSKFMFSKLLTKMSDLRELSDTHNHQNLQLENDEISSIQHQLQHLKINPYPECKVIPDDTSSSTSADPSSIHDCLAPHQQQSGLPNENSSYSTYASAVSQQQQPNLQQYRGPLMNSYSSGDQQPPSNYQQTHAIQSQIQPPHHQLIGQEATVAHAPSFSVSDTNRAQHQQCSAAKMIPNNQLGDPASQPDATSANMTMQFMMAVQKTVNQVVNAPSFGYDWVKPDYQFDRIDDQLLDAITASTPVHHASSETDPSSPESNSSSSSSVPKENSTSATVEETLTLSPKTMEQFYEALEEYTDLYG